MEPHENSYVFVSISSATCASVRWMVTLINIGATSVSTLDTTEEFVKKIVRFASNGNDTIVSFILRFSLNSDDNDLVITDNVRKKLVNSCS